MSGPFRHRTQVRWNDVDFNGHMGNAAYLDHATDSRFAFFQSRGLAIRDFARLRFGPVIFTDELAYYRELHLMEPLEVALESVGLSADGGRFRLRNTFLNAQGERCAVLLSAGAWMDLDARKLRIPPEPLLEVMRAMPRAEDFSEIPAK